MKRFRSILFWCHLIVALVVGTIVLLMSATGVLLTYERQILYWADTHAYEVGPDRPDAHLLSADELLARIELQEGDRPSSLLWRSDPDAPVAASYGRDRTVYVNAYSGKVLGSGSSGAHAFFEQVTGLHRWLGAGGDNRRVGRAITGACNLGFLFLVVSGFYLWWPRNWSRKALRSVTFFRRGLSPKARDFNWHNVIGFWSGLPLLAIVVSGVVISYPWASRFVFTLAGEQAPAGRPGGGPPGASEQEQAISLLHVDSVRTLPLEGLLSRAEAHLPDWRTVTLQVPSPTDTTVSFNLDRSMGGQPQNAAQLALSRVTGETVRWESFSTRTKGQRIRSILRFTHTGEVLGIVGQTLAGLVSLGTMLMVYTGLALTWRRYRQWRRRIAVR